MVPKSENQNRFKSTVFHALSDSIRLEILEFLRDGEKCVCEIIPHLNLIQPVVSRHLKILKDSGLVVDRKDGNKRFYSITDPGIYRIVDDITPELASTLTQRIMDQMVCR
jgi:ArsR family transcriptional regulator